MCKLCKHDFGSNVLQDRDLIHVSDMSNFQNLPRVTSTFDIELSKLSKLTSVTSVVWFRRSRLSVSILSVSTRLCFTRLWGFGFISLNSPRCFCAPADFKLSDLIVIQNKMLCQLLLLYIHKITIKTVNVHCSCYVIAVMPVIGMVATSTFLRSFRQEMFEDDPPT